MILRITAQHIQQATKRCHDGSDAFAESCPIAFALREFSDDVWVSVPDATILRNGVPYTICLPEIARDFAMNFDCGVGVEPIEFEVDLPDGFETKKPKDIFLSRVCV